MKKWLFLILISSIMSSTSVACVYWNETNIRSDLRVFEFNEFAENYLSKPANVVITGKKKNKKTLIIQFEPYNIASLDYAPCIQFTSKYVDDSIEMIEKFLKWEEMAVENKDAFGKEIGKAKRAMGLKNKFFFWSANTKEHYLKIDTCSMGNCSVDNSFYFDKKNTIILLNLLRKLKDDKLPPPDAGDKYN
jgi:hypothetical protein